MNPDFIQAQLDGLMEKNSYSEFGGEQSGSRIRRE